MNKIYLQKLLAFNMVIFKVLYLMKVIFNFKLSMLIIKP